MVVLIGGASHTGKTRLAQKILEKYGYPYLSVDHLKMGLIRSGYTDLTPMEDDKLTDYLWPVVREMAKTAIENGQNLVIEGCYIPFGWRESFGEGYGEHIRCRFLIMSRRYIEGNFGDIRDFANVIEARLDDSWLNPEDLIRENEGNLESCLEYGCEYFLIDKEYDTDRMIRELMDGFI